ncbi:MAG: glycosyltransferase family 2 protein [Gammaproteobacteria bacterium]|nr:glycosyltransferase family 2 protein [Gammaproteobacteria bacterium]
MFYRKRVKRLERRLKKRYELELDTLRCRIDLDDSLLDNWLKDRNTAEYQAVFDEPEPLISICIATYNRGKLLTERAIPSVLNQTYSNLELIVVGDNCQDDTVDRIARIDDPRLTFINLDKRGAYPDDSHLRWMVAGIKPENHALTLAQGRFITHLDDDDYFPLDRIEKLLAFAQENHYDFVWHPFHYENEIGKWKLIKALEFARENVTTSSVFYHHWFRQIPSDINAYRLKEPCDWNRFRKFRYLGINAGRYPEPMLFHHKERSQSDG